MRLTLVPGVPLDREPADSDSVVLVGVGERVYTLGPEPLGAGAQAEVWPGLRDDGVRVAIKLSHATPGSVRAVTQEAALLEAIAAAGATGAVPCLDHVEWGTRKGFVLPLYEQDVDHYVAACIAASGGVAIERVLEITATVARSLGRLHALELPGADADAPDRGRVVHRDIKPENILVDADGGIHLADFGGSLVVDGPGSMALGVFGSPMWAPFDQMLPGLPEPNPTWDTYACCVMLFWWLTNGRPAYQSDPSPMFTPVGHTIWEALWEFGEATELPERRAALARLLEAREGTRAAELVDVRGHGAIQAEDRAALAEGVERLADPVLYGAEALKAAARSLADILARALSPISHPSPPNRFWSADDLADELESVATRLAQARATRIADLERTKLRVQVDTLQASARAKPRRRAGRPAIILALAMSGAVGLLVPAGLLAAWMWPAAPVRDEAPGDSPLPVPAGSFSFGDTFGDGEADERPVRTVTLPAFRIQRTEVSNAAYQECVTAGVCTPLAWKVSGSPWELGAGKNGELFRGLGGPEQPAVGVTFPQASTWCAWKGGRLPTEEEWERAATTAPDGEKRRWPWGETAPDCTLATFGDCGADRTVAVDALPAGASGWGALNMAGNVWEWTSSTYLVVKRDFFRKVTQEHRVLRGGGWNSTVSSMRPTYRRHAEPERVSEVHGFRCVFEGG